jgi:hypothetical protein
MSTKHSPPRQSPHRGRKAVGRHAGMQSFGTDDCPDDDPFDIEADCPDDDNGPDDFLSRGKRARAPNTDASGATMLNPGSARATQMAMLSQRGRFK